MIARGSSQEWLRLADLNRAPQAVRTRGLDDGAKFMTMATGAQHYDASAQQVSVSSLFLEFLRLGLTAFGGPAMVAYIRDLAVRKKCWLSEEAFADGAALCQSIPGATAMQTAAYVGLRVGGTAGSLAAFVGFGLPAFVFMVVLSGFYTVSRDIQPVASAFRGLHVIVVALIANAVVTFGRSSIKTWRDAILACGAATFLFFRGSPILAIVAAAGVAALLYRDASLPMKAVQTGAPQQANTAPGSACIDCGRRGACNSLCDESPNV